MSEAGDRVVNRGAIVACLLAAALFGAATPAMKPLSNVLDPQLLAGLLYLGAALFVAPGAFGRGRRWRIPLRQAWRVAVAIVLGGGIAPVLMLTALARSEAASVSIWLNLETVWTALLAWALFREHLGRSGWAAMVLVAGAGVAVAVGPGIGDGGAIVLVALACLAWGLDNNLTSTVDALTPAQTTFAKGLFAGGFNLAVAFHRVSLVPTLPQLGAALAIGAAGYGLSLVLYIGGSQRLGAARSQMLFATAPFWGTALSWIALGEPVRAAQLVGAGIMAVALALLFVGRHVHPHRHEGMEHTHWHRHDDSHHDHVHPELPPGTAHSHPHVHGAVTHAHSHWPDLHHRHVHEESH